MLYIHNYDWLAYYLIVNLVFQLRLGISVEMGEGHLQVRGTSMGITRKASSYFYWWGCS